MEVSEVSEVSGFSVLFDECKDVNSYMSTLPDDLINLINLYFEEYYECYYMGDLLGITHGYNTQKKLPLNISNIAFGENYACLISDNILYVTGAFMSSYYQNYNFGLSEFAVHKLLLNNGGDKNNIHKYNYSKYVDKYIPLFDFASINERVRKIVCGNNHTVILTYTNNVYTFGDNSKGQLGISKNIKYNPVTLVEKDVTDICIYNSMTVILKDGCIYITYPNGTAGFYKLVTISNINKIYGFKERLMFIVNGNVYIITDKYTTLDKNKMFKNIGKRYPGIIQYDYNLYKIRDLTHVIDIISEHRFICKRFDTKEIFAISTSKIKLNISYRIDKVFNLFNYLIVFGRDSHIYTHNNSTFYEYLEINLPCNGINLSHFKNIKKIIYTSQNNISIIYNPNQTPPHP